MAASFAQPIDASTRYCAVYGHPIHHSASPAMQNAALAELQLNWRYLAFPVHPDHLAAAIDGARRMKFIGLNLTVPHKVLALAMVDEVDASARAWGAINTIRFEARDDQGVWQPLAAFDGEVPSEVRSHGFNTDAEAIVRSLREDLDVALPGATVLQLGAGGAGRVSALQMAAQGVADLHLVNRSVDKAEAVASDIRQRFPQVNVHVGYPSGQVDLVLNATSLGLREEDPCPLDAKAFSLSRARAVYDMIYRPAQTSLLQAAARAGCRTANGLGMLLHQGAAALELWCGQKAPLDVMKQALTETIYGH